MELRLLLSMSLETSVSPSIMDNPHCSSQKIQEEFSVFLTITAREDQQSVEQHDVLKRDKRSWLILRDMLRDML